MASFQEIMAAAVNAEKAGDTEAARTLVQAAQAMQQAEPLQNGDTARNAQAGTFSADITPPVAPDGGFKANPEQDRFGDTIAYATKPSRESFGAFAGGLMNQDNSPTYNALPENMPNVVKGPVAAVGDLGGAALSGIGVGLGLGAGLVGEAFGGSPTMERKLAGDLMVASEVSVPELAGVSSTSRMLGTAARAGDVAPKTAAQAGARAADDLGITPALGMTGKVPAMVAAGLEKVPFTGGIIARDASRAVGEVETAFQRAVGKLGRVSNPEGAGRKLQAGLEGFVQRGKTKANELYASVANHIPESTRIKTPETVAAIQDALAPFADNPEIAKQLGLNKWAAIASDMEQGLSWRAAMDMRSSIGESIGKINGALADMDQGKLKLVYGKLTNDLDAAAKAAGPEAYSAWTRANKYYKGLATRVERSLDQTITAKSPERAFEAFVNATKADRATSDITRLRKIRASLSRDDWNDISASIVERLGRSRPGQQNAAGDAFSPTTFLTEWSKMDKEAKRILLPEPVRVELEKLAAVSERVKSGNLERNASNTGTAVLQGAAGASAINAPMTTAAALGTANLSARFLTSTISLRALNKHLRGDSRALKAMAGGRGPFARDATTILRMSAADAAEGGPAANRAQSPAQIAN